MLFKGYNRFITQYRYPKKFCSLWKFFIITQKEPSLLCTFALRKILGYGKRTERSYQKKRELLAVV